MIFRGTANGVNRRSSLHGRQESQNCRRPEVGCEEIAEKMCVNIHQVEEWPHVVEHRWLKPARMALDDTAPDIGALQYPALVGTEKAIRELVPVLKVRPHQVLTGVAPRRRYRFRHDMDSRQGRRTLRCGALKRL